MKTVFKASVILSLILLILISFELIDSYMSLKFDPENYSPNEWQRDYSTATIQSKIMWLWGFVAYIFATIIILIRAIRLKVKMTKR